MKVVTGDIKLLSKYNLFIVFSIAYLLISYIYLKNYFVFDFTSIAGIILIPYLVIINKERRGATRFFVVASLLFLAACITKVTLLYFLSIGFALLFTVETYVGATNYLFIFIWSLISSGFKYFNNAFGFPVRLEMSEMAGRFLTFAGIENKVLGNVIQINSTEFSVDPACVGLKMMSISLVITIFFLAFYQRKTGKNLNFIKTVMVLLGAILLNLVNNQVRIVLLVYFTILPDNPMHYVIGLLGLTVYVIIPILLFVRWMYKKTKKEILPKPTIKTGKWRQHVMNVMLLTAIAAMATTFANKNEKPGAFQPCIHLQEYHLTTLPFNVIKLEKPGILIYIKPIVQFYEAEHSPTICWIGSGYNYKNVKKEKVGNTEIYTGIMVKENEIIYTAWWFDNGDVKTINQMQWRWNMLSMAKRYCLINVSSATQEKLMEEVNYLLRKNIFK